MGLDVAHLIAMKTILCAFPTIPIEIPLYAIFEA